MNFILLLFGKVGVFILLLFGRFSLLVAMSYFSAQFQRTI